MKLEKQFGEATLIIEADHVARQASGAVMVRCEDTIVLVTVVSTRDQRTGIDFLPLTVEYQERYYSVGRIPGNFFRREVGRPSEKETLIARLIDRPCRPLFPEGWNYETQIIATVLSVDEDYDADMLALIGASAALEISDIPFQGPIAGTRVVRVDGELVTNPVQSQIEKSDLNIIVAGSREAVVMVEGEAIEVEEEVLLEAVFLAQKEIQPILDMQEELKAALGKPKRQPPPFEQDEAFATMVKDQYRAEAKEALLTPAKQERHEKSRLLRERAVEELSENYPDAAEKISLPFEELERDILRDLILKEEKRIDGRSVKEVRPINCQVAVLPRAHGSAIFTRGETQALGIATLGTSHDDQRLDALIGETSKSFMLHYNFPPYCVGEARRLGPPKRRDVGHGALAERALKSVLPDQEEFPYTIRVVSEILESNGSSSMATVCAGTMALMDAGVPIRSPIAGVAMGLVVENGEVVILTDIIGDEDHLGDMDLKIAGSTPKTTIIEINPDKIRDLIGPQGKVIRAIQSETDTRIDVEDTGKVIIYARNAQSADTAIKQIKEVTQEAEVDQIYKGKVVKIMDFGAFVEILPGTDGLVHISQLAPERVKAVTDVVKEGDEILVKVLDIDKQGKIRLSRKAVLEEAAGKRH